MPSFKIVSVDADSAYCVVTLNNGATFGQTVYGVSSKTEAGIEAAMRSAIERIEAQESTIEPQVLEAVQSNAVKEL